MSDEPLTPPVDPGADAEPAPESPRRPRSQQDKRIANDLAEWGKMLKTAQSDSEISAALAIRGFDAEEFAEGDALHNAATKAFNTRQASIGDSSTAVSDQAVTEDSVREAYAQFRQVVRASFSGAADQQTLNLGGTVPVDRDNFLTTARASYEAAKGEGFKPKMPKRGYSDEALGALIADLDELESKAAAQDTAEGAAVGATAARNEKYEAVKAWIKEFKGVARGEFRQRADLKKKLGL